MALATEKLWCRFYPRPKEEEPQSGVTLARTPQTTRISGRFSAEVAGGYEFGATRAGSVIIRRWGAVDGGGQADRPRIGRPTAEVGRSFGEACVDSQFGGTAILGWSCTVVPSSIQSQSLALESGRGVFYEGPRRSEKAACQPQDTSLVGDPRETHRGFRPHPSKSQ